MTWALEFEHVSFTYQVSDGLGGQSEAGARVDAEVEAVGVVGAGAGSSARVGVVGAETRADAGEGADGDAFAGTGFCLDAGARRDAAFNGLRDVSLRIRKGECVVITGPSGCGKTTLTRLANGLIPAVYVGRMSGEVRVLGRALDQWEMDELACSVGSVFQNPRSQFFNLDTVSELAFGCENMGVASDEIRERVRKTARDLRMEHLLDRDIRALSGGEKQTVAVGAVYAMEPCVFVLDEPTAALDVSSMRHLAQVVGRLKAAGNTVLVAEHRLWWLAGIADRVVLMDGGRITGDFTAAEFSALSPDERARRGLRAWSIDEVAAGCGSDCRDKLGAGAWPLKAAVSEVFGAECVALAVTGAKLAALGGASRACAGELVDTADGADSAKDGESVGASDGVHDMPDARKTVASGVSGVPDARGVAPLLRDVKGIVSAATCDASSSETRRPRVASVANGAGDAGCSEPVLRVRGLCVRYGRRGADVLRDLSFDAFSGRAVALAGRNGAGKTTFMRCLAGLHAERAGVVEVCGKRMSPRQRAGRVYLAMQESGYQLFSDTVYGELTAALQAARAKGGEPCAPGNDDAYVNQRLRDFGLDAFSQRHPLSLSGGQRQRLAIAAGSVQGSRVIVLDEPTSGLDLRNMRLVAREIERLKASGTCVIVVTHDFEFACASCDEIAVLSEGRISERFDLGAKTIMRARLLFGFD